MAGHKRTLLLFQIVISVTAMGYVLWGINFTGLLDALASYSFVSMFFAVLLLLFCCWTQAIRFAQLFTPCLATVSSFQAVMIALGLNNILPAKGGELAKILYVHKNDHRPTAAAISATFWERFFDANALFLLAICILQSWIEPTLQRNMALFFGFAWLCLWSMRFYSNAFEYLWRHATLLNQFSIINHLKDELLYGMQTRQLLTAVLTTSAVWISYGLYSVYTLLYVADFYLNIGQGIVVFLIIAAGQLIPSSPGSLGVFEASVVFGLSRFGIGREPALAIALFMRMIQYIPTLIAAFILLFKLKFFNQKL